MTTDRKFSVDRPVSICVDNDGFQMSQNSSSNNLDNSVTFNSVNCDDQRKRKKSLFQYAKEALPRLENYRNSRRSKKRPSIGELHGTKLEDSGGPQELQDQSSSSPSHGIKLGWIQGVFIPCLLNIWGVMLFLRVSWVVGQAGIGLTLVIIAISAVICVVTTLSLSAISTNGEVKGGGIYYIISRSLGPEFGASTGIVFAFANAVAASINTIGFCDSLNDLLHKNGLKIIDNGSNDVRIVGTIAIIVMIIICAVGMEWESKAQNFLVITIVAAMVDFVVGVIIGPTNEKQKAEGFVGLQTSMLSTNWGPDYRKTDGVNYDFFQVFAIFFPSVTGIQAGANISGDLKDPSSAIPKGTLLALLISMTSYALFAILAGGAAYRDASGNITDVLLGNVSSCITTEEGCNYGLTHNYQMMGIMSSWEPLIYAGCFAATLSTALTNILSVPRLIQALGVDEIYPGLFYFSKGYGKANEPYRGYVLTFLVSVGFLLIADLNAIGPLISNFYLASYALINFCTFHAALMKQIGWRPTFKYYNTWLSLFGFIACVIIMFLINWWSSLVIFIVILMLYLVVVYRKPDVNWGSSTQAQVYKTALTNAHKLVKLEEHVKNYNPQILLLCGTPYSRPALVDFANMITKNNSLLVIGNVETDRLSYEENSTLLKRGYSWLRNNKIKAFYGIIDNTNFGNGVRALLQTSGIGKLRPNILMMGYKTDWAVCESDELSSYFNVLHEAFESRLSVAILRINDGLDYSRLTGDDYAGTITKNNDEKASNWFKYKKEDAIEGVLQNPFSINKVLQKMNLFRKRQEKGYIDVWWLYDDGGLTMLLPYIISTRNDWANCKLRIFALASNENDMQVEQENMANLLSKFRLQYYSLKMISVSDKPSDSTMKFFYNLLADFKKQNGTTKEPSITDTEISNFQERTNRHLRLRELLLENSSNVNLIVMSLPMPRKGIPAPLYMAWLEVLTRDLPPYLLTRGNQQSVLTFYS